MTQKEKFEQTREAQQKQESITGDLQTGKHDLVSSQKQHVAELKDGKASGITNEFGKPIIFDEAAFGKQTDSTTEVSQIPETQSPVMSTSEVNFVTYRDSAQSVDRQAQGGTRETPKTMNLDNMHPEKGRIRFFKEPDGHSVAVTTDFKSVMRSVTDNEGNTRVYSEQVESFTGRTDVYRLGDGKTLMVSMKNNGAPTDRKDEMTPLPSDGCCIYLIDENTGKALRYPPDGKFINYGDGSNVEATLEHFRSHWPGSSTELKQFGGGEGAAFGTPQEGSEKPTPAEKSAGSQPREGSDNTGGPPERTEDGIKEGTEDEQAEALRKAFEERKSGVKLSAEEQKAVLELEDAIIKGDSETLEGTVQRLARTKEIDMSHVMTEMNHDLQICGAGFDTALDMENNLVWCLATKGSDSFYTLYPAAQKNAQVTKADPNLTDPVTNRKFVQQVPNTDAGSYLDKVSEQMRKSYWVTSQFG